MPESISEKIVEKLPLPAAGNKVHFFSGSTLQGKKAPAGFGVRVTAGGTKSFVLFHRAAGRKYLETLGRWDANDQGGTLTVRDAIVAAEKLAKSLKNGKREDPRPVRTRKLQDGDKPEGLDVAGLLDRFIERYVEKEKKLRSGDQYKSTFDRLVKPAIGNIGIYDIKRPHVADMLDEIADDSGPVMADRTLSYVRKAFNWYAKRDEAFLVPIVPGLRESTAKERKRPLKDDEIRDVWAALKALDEAPACYPGFVKCLLLTGTRRNETANMSVTELDGDVWTIPGARYKRLPKDRDKDHVIPLSNAAAELIRAQAPTKPSKNAHFVFSTTDGAKAFSGFSKAKIELDKAIAAIREREGRPPMDPPWRLHDLRHTARTLMGRAKVPTDHAELALGHLKSGVRGTYDHHEYFDEKRAAFEALAALVSRILNPASNVEELATRRAAAVTP